MENYNYNVLRYNLRCRDIHYRLMEFIDLIDPDSRSVIYYLYEREFPLYCKDMFDLWSESYGEGKPTFIEFFELNYIDNNFDKWYENLHPIHIYKSIKPVNHYRSYKYENPLRNYHRPT